MLPPALSELSERLVKRNSETERDFRIRTNAAESEIACVENYDYIVVNNVPEQAAEDMYCIIRANRNSVTNNREIIQNLVGGKRL